MSQFRVTPSIRASSDILQNPLQQQTFLNNIKTLEYIICSSFGPNGKLKCIRNTSNGHVFLTSSCKRILSTLSPICPLTKLMVDTVKSHLNVNSDNGFHTMMLCLNLIQISQNASLPPQLFSNIIENLMQKCFQYLESDNCKCKVPISFDNLDQLLSLVNSVLDTKPGCCFSHKEQIHLNLQIVKAFLGTIADIDEKHDANSSVGQIMVVTREGWPVSSSCIKTGLLWAPLNSFPNEQEFEAFQNLRLVLVKCSLAGDEVLKPHVNKVETVHIATDNCFLSYFRTFGNVLLENKVKMIACQKVIHPLFKKYLQSKGIVCIERLGKEATEHLKCLSGAKPIESLKLDLHATAFGFLKSVERITLYEKTYLLFKGRRNSISTLLLCSSHEEALSEAKVVTEQAISALYSTLQRPWVLLGGGCTETHLAVHLSHKVRSEVSQISSELGSNPVDVLQCLELCLLSILKPVAALYPDSKDTLCIDQEYGHLWDSTGDPLATCKCGQLKQTQLNTSRFNCFDKIPFVNEPLQSISQLSTKAVILDGFNSRISAYKTATSVSAAVLRTGMCIVDRN